ncbi:unnamed protein product, partial [Phaeothamnion confervicola]
MDAFQEVLGLLKHVKRKREQVDQQSEQMRRRQRMESRPVPEPVVVRPRENEQAQRLAAAGRTVANMRMTDAPAPVLDATGQPRPKKRVLALLLIVIDSLPHEAIWREWMTVANRGNDSGRGDNGAGGADGRNYDGRDDGGRRSKDGGGRGYDSGRANDGRRSGDYDNGWGGPRGRRSRSPDRRMRSSPEHDSHRSHYRRSGMDRGRGNSCGRESRFSSGIQPPLPPSALPGAEGLPPLPPGTPPPLPPGPPPPLPMLPFEPLDIPVPP